MTVLVTSAMAIYLIVSVAHVFKQEQSRLELIWQTRQNTASLFSMLVLVVCALMEILIWSVFFFVKICLVKMIQKFVDNSGMPLLQWQCWSDACSYENRAFGNEIPGANWPVRLSHVFLSLLRSYFYIDLLPHSMSKIVNEVNIKN